MTLSDSIVAVHILTFHAATSNDGIFERHSPKSEKPSMNLTNRSIKARRNLADIIFKNGRRPCSERGMTSAFRNRLAEQFGEELLGPRLRHLHRAMRSRNILLGQPGFRWSSSPTPLPSIRACTASRLMRSAWRLLMPRSREAVADSSLQLHRFDAERRTDIPEQQSVHIFDPETGRHQRRDGRTGSTACPVSAAKT